MLFYWGWPKQVVLITGAARNRRRDSESYPPWLRNPSTMLIGGGRGSRQGPFHNARALSFKDVSDPKQVTP